MVHSFDGEASELEALLGLGLDIGLNGCSLRSAANLATAVRVPPSRLHLETDAPWCSIKRTHAGHAHVRPLRAPSGEPYAGGHSGLCLWPRPPWTLETRTCLQVRRA